MALPNYKEIMELIKKGATFEAQEKIIELREKAFALQEENLELKEQILSLKSELEKIRDFQGDPCPNCKQPGWYIKSSIKDRVFGDLGGTRRTYACKFCDLSEEKLITD